MSSSIAESISASIFSRFASSSGVNRSSASRRALGTGSSHTVCQMPDTGVYQMPFGSRICLPRGCSPADDGSHADSTSSFAPSRRKSVRSKENAVEPPAWLPTSAPLSQSVASKSTASKCTSTRWPCQAAGTVNERRYQRRSLGVTGLPTPESVDSTQNGTRIFPSKSRGAATVLGRIA